MPAPSSTLGTHSALSELSGTVLESRYQLGGILGAGGMGAVFEATHLRLDRRVAIKVLRPVFVGHDEFIRRFLREAKAASKIRHRNVVEILDFGETSSGLVYSVMEFLEGQDLEELIRSQPDGRLTWARACGLLMQIASGLKAAHGCGVIHRDIKPANCFLTHEDHEPIVKVVDFGIAKVDEVDQSQQLTGTSQILGTPNYIAPELVRTKTPASPQSDIYSLGVLAYRMLTGRVPFTGETPFEVLRRSCFDPVSPLREHVPELPQAVEGFVLTLLAKEPSARPPDMQAVRDELLALGRDTLPPRELEIPVSAPLSLDPPMPTGSLEGPTLRRSIGRASHPPLASTVRIEPVPISPRARVPAETDPTAPLANPSLRPPSGRVDAIPQVLPQSRDDLPTISSAGLSAAEPRGRSGWAISGMLAILGLLGLGVVLPWSAMRGEDDAPPTNAAQATKPHIEATAPRVNSSSPLVVSAEVQVPEPTLSDARPDASPNERSLEASLPEPIPSNPARSQAEPSSSVPTAKPKSAGRKSVKPELPDGTPSAPPADDDVIRQLQAQIKSKCDFHGPELLVSFRVRPEGKVLIVNVSDDDPSQCITKLVTSTAFRARDESKRIEFKVK